jgi:hypothetical protein
VALCLAKDPAQRLPPSTLVSPPVCKSRLKYHGLCLLLRSHAVLEASPCAQSRPAAILRGSSPIAQQHTNSPRAHQAWTQPALRVCHGVVLKLATIALLLMILLCHSGSSGRRRSGRCAPLHCKSFCSTLCCSHSLDGIGVTRKRAWQLLQGQGWTLFIALLRIQ